MTMNRWLALSLTANLALVSLLLFARRTATPPIHSSTTPPVAAKRDLPANKTPSAPGAGSDWRSWLGQLRADGVPDKVMAGLVVADFENRWEAQQRELQRKFDNGDIDADVLAQADSDHASARDQELRLA